ncbi:NAD(P)/FAD-dependent oxidoreductase [Mycobacterium sp.]|uniref:NAD(P)/FAD-dependent oxidoreductase n=1 Tax=Mycobacterium sp. TaxID=1785 RepID=UPI002DB391BE|nr:FAD-dependent oxidoreductase [Mycobacterium sp.]
MASEHSHVIAGAGLAGAKAAETLRGEGFSGRIVLIGAEPELPYERPPLSKGYLLGKEDRVSARVFTEQWYADNSVELLQGRRVNAVDRVAHQVELDTGERIGYTKLLLTTGASPRRLHIRGSHLDGVHDLRTIDDTDKLRDAIRSGGRVVVIGGGWIGMEVAAAARAYGCDVTVVEPSATPLRPALGPEMGGFFGDLHRRNDVDLRVGHRVVGLRGNGSRVSAVLSDHGTEIPAEVVLVAIGALPNTELADRAGLMVDNGVVVDASFRTSDPDIYAAGDVANSFNSFYRRHIRVEHWASALHGGPAAARAMLGQSTDNDALPYFFTDQYDVGMEFSGWFAPGGYDTVVTRGDIDARAFHAFWLAGERVVAGMHVNQWDEGIAPVQNLIRAGQPVDVGRLTDPSVPLATLVGD